MLDRDDKSVRTSEVKGIEGGDGWKSGGGWVWTTKEKVSALSLRAV